MTLADGAQIAGLIACLITIARVFIRQGEQIQTIKDHTKRIKDLEDEDFITEDTHDLMQSACRSEIFGDISKCQMDLKSDVKAVRHEMHSMIVHVTDIRSDVKSNCAVVNQIKEDLSALTTELKLLNATKKDKEK